MKPGEWPAFPLYIPETPHVCAEQAFLGITQRDWFAGMALQGMATAAGFQGAPWDKLAQDAYAAADAMIRAQQAKEEVSP